LIEKKSQHLNFGEFSSKFAQAAKENPFIEEPTIIKAEPGSHPVAIAESGVDVYALTHNETSTGVSMPIKRPAGTDGALVLVDATSAAGGLMVDAKEFDTYYFALAEIIRFRRWTLVGTHEPSSSRTRSEN
jgi:phosphoserine aminotransferase